jgi:hypothetical protein
MASPTSRVEAIRDCMIAARFLAPYLQLTLWPVRLITASAPSISVAHAPRVDASHLTTRHGAARESRLRTTTSCPSAWNTRARIVPTCPAPPGITIFMAKTPKLNAFNSQSTRRVERSQRHF